MCRLDGMTRWASVTSYVTIILAVVVAGCSQPPAGDTNRGRGGMMGGQMGGHMGTGEMMGAAAPDTSAAPIAQASAAAAVAGCPPVSQDLVDEGRAVFSGTGTCFACHGATASGTAIGPDLTDATWLNIDGSYAAIVGLVHTGVPHPKQYSAPMPALGGAALSESQVCAVAGYVYSVSHR